MLCAKFVDAKTMTTWQFRNLKASQGPTFADAMRFHLISVLLWGVLALGAHTGHASAGIGSVPMDSTLIRMSNKQLFVEGSILMEEGFWHEALRVWSEVVERSPRNRVYKFKLGLCLLEIGEDWLGASEALKDAVAGTLTTKYDPFNHRQTSPPFEALLYLAEAKRRQGKFNEARTHIKVFNRKAGRKHSHQELAAHMMSDLDFAEAQLASPTPAMVKALNVNDVDDETRPMLTVDGRTLFFSSNRARENGSNHGRRDPNTLAHYDDVYVSRLLADTTWSEPEFLNLGASYHAIVVGTDAFGESVVLQDHDGYTYELKVSSQWERGWTASVPFILGKNQPTRGEVAFFPGQDRIVVSLETRRGEGGFDLYECELDDRGRWGKPVSLGAEVNSLGNEVSPFVAADGKTLFFASNGLPSVGGYDIHRAVRGEDGSWSAPTPMGVPINSVEDEMSFVMGAKGELGYFSSRRGLEARDLNLYEVAMNQASPIEGNVMVMSVDASEEEFIAGTLTLRDLNTGSIVQTIEKCAQSSQYKFIVPAGGEYVLEREAVEDNGKKQTLPAVQRRISVPSDAESDIVDVAFAELFRPVLEEIAMEGKSGLELPPFTGIKVVVESSEVAGIGDVPNQEELEGSEIVADLVEEAPQEMAMVPELSVEEAVEADVSWTSNVMELSELSGEWTAIQIGTFRGTPRDSWLLKAGEQFVVERLENGLTRWYVGVSRSPSETQAAYDELQRKGGFARSLLVRLNNGRRSFPDRRMDDGLLPLVIREEGQLDGSATFVTNPTSGTNMSSPICPLSLDDDIAGELVLAIQFYSNQVHTGRMSIEPVVDRVLELAQEGTPHLRIEGSASSLATTRPRGNPGLASDRAENVRYRLLQRLAYEGLEYGVDYKVEMVKRVQPDGEDSSMTSERESNPARHQYVRVDVELP